MLVPRSSSAPASPSRLQLTTAHGRASSVGSVLSGNIVTRVVQLKDWAVSKATNLHETLAQRDDLQSELAQASARLDVIESRHEQAMKRRETEHAQHLKHATAELVEQNSELRVSAEQSRETARQLEAELHARNQVLVLVLAFCLGRIG